MGDIGGILSANVATVVIYAPYNSAQPTYDDKYLEGYDFFVLYV